LEAQQKQWKNKELGLLSQRIVEKPLEKKGEEGKTNVGDDQNNTSHALSGFCTIHLKIFCLNQ